MDIYTGIAFGVVLMACVGILALISLFSMKTKSYDEARAEKKTVVETVKISQHFPKQKKNKKSQKKQKETKEVVNDDKKEAPPSEEELEELPKESELKVHVHVEFKEPEIIPIEDVTAPTKKGQKRKAPVRPILMNKEESAKTSAPPSPSSSNASLNHFENTHPKDDAEKLRSQLVGDHQKIKVVGKQTKTKLEATVPKEIKVTKAQLSEPVSESAPNVQSKANRKKKSEIAILQQLSNDKESGVGVNVLAPLLTQAQLSRSELQLLIDLMLNKQHGPTPKHTEWFEGRSDPVQKLKKQLSEKEKALLEEQERSQGVQTKLKELRTELNAERSRLTALTRNYEQTLAAKTSETQQLASKLQQVVDSHNAEKHSLAQQLQQYQAKLTEEHNAARKLQEEQNTAKELLAQRQQYENHISQLKENEVVLNQQVHQMHAKLVEVKAIQEQLAFRDQQLQDIIAQLEESRHQIADYDQRLGMAQMHENELKMEIHRLQTELRTSKDDLTGFANMEAEMNRLSMLNSKHEEKHLELTRKQEEIDRHAAQLKAQIGVLQNEKEKLMKQVAELSEMQNGAASRENNITKVEVLNLQNALDSTIGQMKRYETENGELKTKLTTLSATHNSLIAQLDELKSKNDDLRTKNWNVMEALQTKEKLLMEKTKELQNIQQTPPIPALGKDASTTTTTPSKDSVTSAAVELIKRIMPDMGDDVTTDNGAPPESPEELLEHHRKRMTDMSEQNKQLTAMVAKYKRIVLDTEGVLNDLQSHAETEETRWREKFAAKEAELQAMYNKTIAQQSENHSTNGPTKS